MATAPVVVGYDGSEHSSGALRWAADTAVTSAAPLVVVVADRRPPAWDADVDGSEWDEQHLEEVRALAEREVADVPDAQVEVRRGAVVPVLLAAAEGAEMLVVGTRGHGPIAGALVGSVSQHLAHHAPCPVVLAKPSAHTQRSRIVVGVDGSGGSAAALEFACRRAQLTGEPVVAVHGWRLGNVPVDTRGNVPPSLAARLTERERLLEDCLAGLAEKFPDVRLRAESVPVVARHALTDASTTASLVAVGSRGLGAFPGMLLGSVSNYVMQHAHCPVAIVR